MSVQFADAFNQLVREKRLDKKLLMETLAAGFSSAIKKKYGATAEVDVVEDKHGNIEIFLLKTVVETVENDGTEISKADAKEYNEKPKVGDEVRINIPFESFGRNAIQITKQILTQKIREFERDRTFEEYEDRIGDIVSGSVQQIDRNSIAVLAGYRANCKAGCYYSSFCSGLSHADNIGNRVARRPCAGPLWDLPADSPVLAVVIELSHVLLGCHGCNLGAFGGQR